MNKRGITPLIATVLLIGLTVIIALIVYVFVTNLAEEQIEETGNEADISLLCTREVNLETEFCGVDQSLTITLKNRGEINLSDLNIFIDSSTTTESFPSEGELISYVKKSFTIPLEMDISDITRITIVPVITSGGNVGSCPEEVIEVDGSNINSCGICGDGIVDVGEECGEPDLAICPPVKPECISCICTI